MARSKMEGLGSLSEAETKQIERKLKDLASDARTSARKNYCSNSLSDILKGFTLRGKSEDFRFSDGGNALDIAVGEFRTSCMVGGGLSSAPKRGRKPSRKSRR